MLPDVVPLLDSTQLPLADSSYRFPAAIDLILGSDVLGQILDGNKIFLGPGRPIAFGTIFNFALLGPINPNYTKPEPQVNSALVNIDCLQPQHSNKEIHSALERFWEVEEVQSKDNSTSDECEENFRSTTTRDPTGRYIVSLPFLTKAPKLGATHAIALRRFLNLERKLQRDPTLRSKYIDFMKEYIDMGHMALCHPSTFKGKDHFYVPHHGIFKANSEKLRTVFDGSCKSSNGVSLNDCLHTGPPLQRDITDIILNFRTHKVVFSTDIQMMFRNILVHPDHRRFQLILWRSSPDQPLLTYALSTVTYGLRPSPFLANRSIIQLVTDEGHRFPQAAQVLTHSIFVDDILTGHDSVDKAIALQTELIELLALGGFHLRKWTSNSRQLLERFPDDQCDIPKDFDVVPDSNAIKVLGMQWIPQTDEFTYHISVPTLEKFTKRSILSTIARLYDPSGWISPVIFRAKLLIQHLWTLKLDWDESAPNDVTFQFQHIFEDLPLLSALRLPRTICTSKDSTYTLHGFADASESGYAAAVYLHETNITGQVHVRLLVSKSKVAPIKTRQTIPKLELSAAHLTSLLISRVSVQLSAHITIQQHFCWSDSTIVLAWLKTPSQSLQVFEANRVSAIAANPCNPTWRHVPSALNPADCASRGISAQELLAYVLWWSPTWLKAPPDTWPTMPLLWVTYCLVSRKMVAHIAVPDLDTDLLTRFSSLDTLVGVTACISRFAQIAWYLLTLASLVPLP
ncbi:hypothetical protein K1T71_014995 [Dendrolimus kikuchii]|nr:hypothetical protein K1T71_014995 [Dendrolimus kikuchii]